MGPGTGQRRAWARERWKRSPIGDYTVTDRNDGTERRSKTPMLPGTLATRRAELELHRRTALGIGKCCL